MLPQLTVEKPFFNSIYQHIRNAHVIARENVSGTGKIEPRQSHIYILTIDFIFFCE